MEYQLVISGTIGSWWNGCSADYVRYVLNNNKDKDVHIGFAALADMSKMDSRCTRHSKIMAEYMLMLLA